ncbi:hypothetical protein EDD21DRAFT_63853, partial [Dissophora ornata]
MVDASYFPDWWPFLKIKIRNAKSSTKARADPRDDELRIMKRGLTDHYQPNYITPNVGSSQLFQKRFYFRYGWFFWFMDLLSMICNKEYVIWQPRTRTDRHLDSDLDIGGVKFVSVEVPAKDSAIDPPIVPKDADDYNDADDSETRIKWFIKQCRLQQGLRWDDGCMFIDDTGRVANVTPCRCGGRDHRQIQLLLGISMLFPLYMAQEDLDFSHLVRAVDSIHATELEDKQTTLEEAITLIYDAENKKRRKKVTKECRVPKQDYYETLKHFVNESQLNDSDFFVARWKLSPDD